MNASRRDCLSLLGAAATLPWLSPLVEAAEAGAAPPHIATNTYPWGTFAKREGREFIAHTDALLGEIAGTGIVGYEPIIRGVADFEGLGERLQKQGLEMRSLYVNSTLHDTEKVEASLADVMAIAKAARELGTKIIVTNPAPIRWGGEEDKTDDQLKLQAASLDRLGASIRQLGLSLAYHNHDAELRQGGREFHHMLTATDPENVKLCLDAHWIYRGCGDSEVAVFDALAHYHERIVELHLRQSEGGTWTEVFAPTGDINYLRLIEYLSEREIVPHLVLEQAVEKGSPHTMTVGEAHRLGRNHLVNGVPRG